MFNKSNFCHIASNNRNEQKGSVFIYKTADTLAQVTQSGYFNEKLIDINVHDLIIHVQYDPVARTLKKSVLIVTERTMDNVETTPILDQTIGDDIDQLGDQVAGIEEKIPGAASAANQLADKAFVNDIKTAIETTIAGINTSISTLNNDLSQTNQNLAQTNQDVDSLQETKQDIATAVNYDNISNCITEIPQDIKLELNNGTLTLKAGSKTYLPNGDGVFDVLTTQSDQTYNFGSTTGQFLFFVKNNGYDYFVSNVCTSGSTDSLSGQSWHVWYDTTNNSVKVYTDNGSTPASTRCLPIALITIDSGSVTRIDQVFNGFGYVGSTKYVLPGVKGLIPNYRNADGSLNNKEFTTSSVMTFTGASTDSVIGFFNGTTAENYMASSVTYDKELNRNIYTAGGVELDMIPYTNIYHQTNGKIDYCTFKKPFHAVDYNNAEFIAHQAMPSNKADSLTIGASGATYTAPADGYFVCVISHAGYVELQNPTTEISSSANVASGGWGRAFLPVSKGQQIIINYGNNPTFQYFRFVFANGAQ